MSEVTPFDIPFSRDAWQSQLKDALDARFKHGTGSPQGVVVADIGCQYIDRDGGAGVTLWVKESGNNTNTGWVAK